MVDLNSKNFNILLIVNFLSILLIFVFLYFWLLLFSLRSYTLTFRSETFYFNILSSELIPSTIILSLKLLNCICQSLLNVQVDLSTNFKDLYTASLTHELRFTHFSLLGIVYLIRQNLENEFFICACIFYNLEPFLIDLCEWIFVSDIINQKNDVSLFQLFFLEFQISLHSGSVSQFKLNGSVFMLKVGYFNVSTVSSLMIFNETEFLDSTENLRFSWVFASCDNYADFLVLLHFILWFMIYYLFIIKNLYIIL